MQHEQPQVPSHRHINSDNTASLCCVVGHLLDYRVVPVMSGVAKRKHDERILEWIKRRCAGQKVKEIAGQCGASAAHISRATNAVRDADVLTACDAEGAYW